MGRRRCLEIVAHKSFQPLRVPLLIGISNVTYI
jgi:hypothetical protein